ncbi:hypothetical protein HK104_006715, partial [Borealophlyctis nickersoniae]
SVPRHSNGYSVIKEKLAKSKSRMSAVKFGVPFVDTCQEGGGWRYRTDSTSNSRRGLGGDGDFEIDWHNLKIDTDKQSYFVNVLEREFPASWYRRGGASRSGGSKGHHVPPDTPKKRATTPAAATATAAEGGGESERDAKGDLPSLPQTSPHPHSTKSAPTPKQMEAALGVVRDARDPTEEFYTTREHFYEQRQRLTQVLIEDLNRMDFERKSNFQRKFKAFKIGK